MTKLEIEGNKFSSACSFFDPLLTHPRSHQDFRKRTLPPRISQTFVIFVFFIIPQRNVGREYAYSRFSYLLVELIRERRKGEIIGDVTNLEIDEILLLSTWIFCYCLNNERLVRGNRVRLYDFRKRCASDCSIQVTISLLWQIGFRGNFLPSPFEWLGTNGAWFWKIVAGTCNSLLGEAIKFHFFLSFLALSQLG